MYGTAVVATEYQSSLMLVRYKNTLDPAAQCNAKTVTENWDSKRHHLELSWPI